MLGNLRQLALQYLLVQALHVLRLEWRLQSHHLIDHASQRPYIRFHIVGLIFPNLRARVVRRSRLSVIQTFWICHLRNIHVTQFCRQIIIQEYVGWFQISVHDFNFVHGLQSSDSLYEDLPNLSLLYVGFLLFMADDFLKDVAIVRQFHDDTK